MFQVQIQMSLLNAHYYLSCLDENCWKLQDEPFRRLLAFHQCSLCNYYINIP